MPQKIPLLTLTLVCMWYEEFAPQDCNVDFVLFHNVTCYTNPLFSRIQVNNTYLLNITCTLVPTTKILGSLECITLFNFQPSLILRFWQNGACFKD